MVDSEKLQEVFLKIIADKDVAKEALIDPAAVFMRYGIEVPDPENVNAIFYEANPALKDHFLASVAGLADDKALEKCNSPECLACKAALTISVGALIYPYLAGAAGAFAAFVVFFNLPDEVTVDILFGGASTYDECLEALCGYMSLC
jgi:hypothetical protein